MNIERDVNAMANLIASKTLQPPLAIGLFGQWGSGKSFFMNKLEGAVGGFAELARKDKKRAGDYRPNIVQIQFNAWHYVDANLWANLVAHIFEELNRWGKDAASPIQQAKETALKNLEVAKEAHAAAEARLEQAKKAVKAAEATRKERLEEVNSNKKELAQAIAIDIWEQVRKSVQLDQNTKEHLQQVGMEVDDIQKSAEQVYAYLTELGTLTGRTKAIWLSMCKGYGGWTALMIGSAILGLGVLGAGAVAKWFSEGAGIVVGFTGPVVALVAGAGNWMKKNVDLVSGAVKPLREFHAKLEQSLKAAEKAKAGKIAAIEKDLDRVNADCTEATKRLDETNRILQAAQAEVEEVVSGRLITRFIEQRAGSADYRKHLGIVAMIREDFSTLSRKIQDYNRLKMAPEPDALEAIQAAVQDLGINRIVLYIDDLDRCPPDRVLEVLQSIHLLLAFHLFVVVVGVDARWVSYSLADQFRGMLAERGPQLVEGASGLPADAATPRDYLEKIFQVPFWIKSMEEDGCKRLIAELVKHDLQSARPAEPDTKAPEVPPNRTPAAERAIQETSAKKTPRPPPVKEPEPEPRPESLHLENNEAVTMGELARFIGRSPRATKRFVNVYRLIKAALPADEIDAFVGSASAPGPFRGVMFLLALVTGVPTLSLAALRRINHPAGDTSFWQIIDAIRNDPSIAPHDEWERLDGFLTADTDSRWESLSVAELVKSVERVEQFSFESRHTLSIAVKS